LGYRGDAFPLPPSAFNCCGRESNPHCADSRSAASANWATAALSPCNAAGRIRTCNDRNLSPAPLPLGYCGSRKSERKLQDSNLQDGSRRPPVFETGPRAKWGQSFRVARRRRESNPRDRLCRPVPRHSATSSSGWSRIRTCRAQQRPNRLANGRPAPMGPVHPRGNAKCRMMNAEWKAGCRRPRSPFRICILHSAFIIPAIPQPPPRTGLEPVLTP
jgi:hypothetical protein